MIISHKFYEKNIFKLLSYSKTNLENFHTEEMAYWKRKLFFSSEMDIRTRRNKTSEGIILGLCNRRTDLEKFYNDNGYHSTTFRLIMACISSNNLEYIDSLNLNIEFYALYTVNTGLLQEYYHFLQYYIGKGLEKKFIIEPAIKLKKEKIIDWFDSR